MSFHNDLINEINQPVPDVDPNRYSSGVNSESDSFDRNRTDGHVIHCDGSSAVISAIAGQNSCASDDYWSVGQLIAIDVHQNRIVGLVYKVDAPSGGWAPSSDNRVNIHVELVGEIVGNVEGQQTFTGGISSYPHIGALTHRIRNTDLATIYQNSDKTSIQVGTISQDSSIPALITIDKMLSQHFAIVGTTGVGKSTAVALLLRKIVAQRPDIRTLILDPHNEYASAFPRHAITLDAASLEMPFWMFTLEEFSEVVFRGRPCLGEEVNTLRDLIPAAKYCYETGISPGAYFKNGKMTRAGSAFTSDTPAPYRIQDLLRLMDERIGQLEGKAERPHLKSLKNRIQSIIGDPRFRFMFDTTGGAEAMDRLLSQVFRLPQNNKPICVFEMSGLPSEVVNVVVSVMCRLAFELGTTSSGAIQTLVVCEEAHRYIPANKDAGFLPTRTAISRIAKEGRKYGVYLGVVSQRPGELDPTILSQCNTVFSMRLGNVHDQNIMRQAITGASRSTSSFLSSLANRECIAFGEAINYPLRMMFEPVAAEDLPGSHIYENQNNTRTGGVTANLASVISAMRNSISQIKSSKDADEQVPSLTSPEGRGPAEQRPTITTNRPRVVNETNDMRQTHQRPHSGNHATTSLINSFRSD